MHPLFRGSEWSWKEGQVRQTWRGADESHGIPTRSSTVRPWKVTKNPNRKGSSSSPTIFQGQAVKLRRCMSCYFFGVYLILPSQSRWLIPSWDKVTTPQSRSSSMENASQRWFQDIFSAVYPPENQHIPYQDTFEKIIFLFPRFS